METLGERLKRLREARRLSATQLAAKAGIGEGAIFKIERGDTKEPGLTVGVKLARALGVTAEELALGQAASMDRGAPQLEGDVSADVIPIDRGRKLDDLDARLRQAEAAAALVPGLLAEMKAMTERQTLVLKKLQQIEAAQSQPQKQRSHR